MPNYQQVEEYRSTEVVHPYGRTVNAGCFQTSEKTSGEINIKTNKTKIKFHMTRSLQPGSEEIPGWILPAKDPRKIPLKEKAQVNAIKNYRCE